MKKLYECSWCGFATTNRNRYSAHVPCPDWTPAKEEEQV